MTTRELLWIGLGVVLAAFAIGVSAPRHPRIGWRVLVHDSDGTYVVRGRTYVDRRPCYQRAATLDRTSDVDVTCALVGQ